MPPSMQSGRCFTVVDLVFEGSPNILLIDQEANRIARPRTQGRRSTALKHPTLGHCIDMHLGPSPCTALLSNQRDKFPLGVGIPLDVALRHRQTSMPGEFLYIPEAPPDL
jgi:hypothetical protein